MEPEANTHCLYAIIDNRDLIMDIKYVADNCDEETGRHRLLCQYDLKTKGNSWEGCIRKWKVAFMG